MLVHPNNYISSISGWSIGNSERARKDAEAILRVVRGARLPVTNNIERSYIPEASIADTVTKYFSDPKFAKFYVVRECEIQIGSVSSRADIVLRDGVGNFVAIAECKLQDRTAYGPKQLKSFLSATDTTFGIFASGTNEDSWIFYENLRHNRFRQIEQSDFEKEVLGLVENE